MRKLIVAAVVGALLALGVAAPASAHANPCAAADDPAFAGKSGFGLHHVVPLVPETHNPGIHHGLQGCVP